MSNEETFQLDSQLDYVSAVKQADRRMNRLMNVCNLTVITSLSRQKFLINKSQWVDHLSNGHVGLDEGSTIYLADDFFDHSAFYFSQEKPVSLVNLTNEHFDFNNSAE